MTLLNHNLFSQENFASLAKAKSQIGNNSHSSKVVSPSKTLDNSRIDNNPKPAKANSFQNEMNKAASSSRKTETNIVSDSTPERKSSESINPNEKKSDNVFSEDNISNDYEQLTQKLEKIKKALSDNSSNEKSNTLKDILAQFLSPEEISELAELGYDSDESILGLIGLSDSPLSFGEGFLSENRQKALNILNGATGNIKQKLSDLSGLSLKQLDELIESLTIHRTALAVEANQQNILDTTDKGKSPISEILAFAGKGNTFADEKTTSNKLSTVTSEESLEAGNGEENKPSANKSQFIISEITGQSELNVSNKNISDNLSVDKFGLNISNKGAGKTAKMPISSKEQAVFRSMKFENITSTTARLSANTQNGGTTTARMLLNPRSLGTVFVEINVAGKTADIMFRTDNADAGKMLEGQISQLKQQLEKEGMTAGKIEYTQEGQDNLSENLSRDNQQNSREEMESRREYIGQNTNNSFSLNTNERLASFSESMEENKNPATAETIQNTTGRSL